MCAQRSRRRYLSPCRIYIHTNIVYYICIYYKVWVYIYIYILYKQWAHGTRNSVVNPLCSFRLPRPPPSTARHFHPPKRSPFGSKRLSGSVLRLTIPAGSFFRARANSCTRLFATAVVDDVVFAKSNQPPRPLQYIIQ